MDLLYSSTRNSEKKITASQAILKGLADDGGLFVPESIPALDVSMDELSRMTYQETASAGICVGTNSPPSSESPFKIAWEAVTGSPFPLVLWYITCICYSCLSLIVMRYTFRNL